MDRNTLHCFRGGKSSLLHAATLVDPDFIKGQCIFTDASIRHWAALLSQIPKSQIGYKVQEQTYEPLAFLSRTFKGSGARWITADKEAFLLVKANSKLDYLLMNGERFDLFTDELI